MMNETIVISLWIKILNALNYNSIWMVRVNEIGFQEEQFLVNI